MEALAALGLACNVVQLVDFSIKTTEICMQIQEHGTSSQVRDLSARVCRLKPMSGSVGIALDDPQPRPEQDQALVDISAKCYETSQDLQKLLEKLEKAPDSKRHATILSTIRTLWHSNDIKELQTRLTAHKGDLDTHILVSLHKSARVYAQETQVHFAALSNKLDSSFSRLAGGLHRTTDLVEEKSEQIRADIRAENVNTRDQMQTGLEAFRAFDSIAKQRQEFFDSLEFREMKLRELQIEAPHPDTCEWIFQEPAQDDSPTTNFIDWLTSPDQLFWICGKPGSGKSVAMAFICSDDRTKSYLLNGCRDNQLTPLIVDFFFWKAGSPMQKTATGFLQSVIHQILAAEPVLYESVIAGNDKLRKRSPRLAWSTQELQTLLKSVLAGLSHSRCLIPFLDGLDEFDEGEECLLDLIKIFRRRQHVKLCLSSRPSPRLLTYIGHTPKLWLQNLNHAMINTFVNARLQQDSKLHALLPNTSRNERIRDIAALASAITAKSKGMFLWAKLAIQSIRDGIGKEDRIDILYQRLQLIPEELDALYNRIWQKILSPSSPYRSEALLFFQLTLHEPLSLVKFILATVPDMQGHRVLEQPWFKSGDPTEECAAMERTILSRCEGFLEIAGASDSYHYTHYPGKVEFMHRTARDFISRRYAQLPEEESEPADRLALRLVKMKCRRALVKDRNLPDITGIANYIYGRVKSQSRATVLKALDLLITLSKYARSDAIYEYEFRGTELAAEDLTGHLVQLGFLDYVLAHLKGTQLKPSHLSYLLVCALRTDVIAEHANALKMLLEAGADRLSSIRGPYVGCLRLSRNYRPMHMFLSLMWMYGGRDPEEVYENHAKMLAVLFGSSADLTKPFVAVYALEWGDKPTWCRSHWMCGQDERLLHLCNAYVVMITAADILKLLFGDSFYERTIREKLGLKPQQQAPQVVLFRHEHKWFRVVSDEQSCQLMASINELENRLRGITEQNQWSGSFEASNTQPPQWHALRDLIALCAKDSSATEVLTPESQIPIPGWGSRQLWELLMPLGSDTDNPRALLFLFDIPKHIFGDLGDDPEAQSLWDFSDSDGMIRSLQRCAEKWYDTRGCIC